MKNLSVKIDYAPALSTEEQQMVMASFNRQARIIHLTKKDISLRLNEIITKAYFDTSSKSKLDSSADQTHAQFVISFTEELQKKFHQLTMDDVEIAFYKGLRGEYGDYFGINNVSGYFFCKNYQLSEQRRIALEKQKKHTESLKHENVISQAEKDVMFYVGALQKFNKFKEAGILIDAGASSYDYLYRLGIIVYNEESRQIFKDRAKKKLSDDINHKLKMRTITSIQSMDLFRNLYSSDSTSMLMEAKRLALEDFFKALIDFEIELHEKLEPFKPMSID